MDCWKCNSRVASQERIGFREHCPGCDRPLHCCRNCGFHDPAYNNQCREPMAELVSDKERANFCEYFQPATFRAPSAAKNDARERLEDLFRKKR